LQKNYHEAKDTNNTQLSPLKIKIDKFEINFKVSIGRMNENYNKNSAPHQNGSESLAKKTCTKPLKQNSLDFREHFFPYFVE
jgi:hypothetical protein